jgi:murein DD-endopeptidase MepM/ murein hydrolase activator NlpD
VIAIGFPFKRQAQYEYRDNFGDPREGEAEAYNHARIREGDRVLRAHDGIDFYAPTGTPVVAPFDGVVIDPSQRWQPWIPERYGNTTTIVSHEPTSDGYAAVMSHLDALYVEPGQLVHRGEVVGTVGDTGNAEGGRPHLHFELRAPFLLSWEQVGENRLIDAFNPYPSLRSADPKLGR